MGSAACGMLTRLALNLQGIAAKKGWNLVLIGTCADFIGAAIGAVFVWLIYLGHFSIVPPPPVISTESTELSPEEAARKKTLERIIVS